MKEYNCECCKFKSNDKTKYDRHIQTKKHLECIQMYPKMYPNVSTMYPNVSKKNELSSQKLFECKYCGKSYKYSQGLSKHIKYTCKKNEDEDMKELVKLMNEKIEEQNKMIKTMQSDQKKLKQELETRDKKITKLSKKLQINANNNNIITNNYNNIQLLSYKDTDISHLTQNDFINSLKRQNNCVKLLTEKIHYNPQKPENMNIYISNLKNKYVMVYENDKWQLKDYFENIYEHKEFLLEEWIDREKDNYPELRDKFEKYLNNKENDNILNTIKEDIKLMMYNNRENVKQKLINN
tara:strand:- start:262 stop:1146 length:885 start_codon:yes stop_codon:yes gene_type:complete